MNRDICINMNYHQKLIFYSLSKCKKEVPVWQFFKLSLVRAEFNKITNSVKIEFC
jgi:hypothetical protein